jgi:hypothetical protein
MKTLEEIKIQLELLKPVLKEKFQVEPLGYLVHTLRDNRKRKVT